MSNSNSIGQKNLNLYQALPPIQNYIVVQTIKCLGGIYYAVNNIYNSIYYATMHVSHLSCKWDTLQPVNTLQFV